MDARKDAQIEIAKLDKSKINQFSLSKCTLNLLNMVIIIILLLAIELI